MAAAEDEFALIQRYFAWPARQPTTRLGVGDDAAIVAPPAGQELVVATDTLVEGRHFLSTDPADAIGWKALAVNLSDIAAMGATPLAFTLALTLPEHDAGWLGEFSSGLRTLAERSGVDLIGGDTTRGPLSITVSIMGSVATGRAVRRSGAQPADCLAVSGFLGDAALALKLGPAAPAELRDRLWRPQPRYRDAELLRDYAHAAIDVSDGLSADLGHLLQASSVGACLERSALPLSAAALAAAPDRALLEECALSGGDDYELLISLPEDRLARLQALSSSRWTRIGVVEAAPGLRMKQHDGTVQTVVPRGFQHF